MGAVGDDFYRAVLNSLGAPVTPNTLQICRDWQSYEGGSASWNPWNTTQWAPGATEYNDAHVRNYPDEGTGIGATVSTLRNGYYPDVVRALVADLPESEWGLSPAILGQINTWGTHGFADHLAQIAKPEPTHTRRHIMSDTVVVHVTDAGGQYIVDGDGATWPANGDYAEAVPMTAADYNALVAHRTQARAELLAALQHAG